MVVLDEQKENFLTKIDDEAESLREERRRTGRYVASGTAIFLSLLGIYQALIRGTPEYAALFLPAVIMFIYVLWILYASRSRKKISKIENENEAPTLAEVTTATESPSNLNQSNTAPKTFKEHNSLSRTYSIA